MRRYLVLVLPVLVMLAVLYVIGSAGSARHPKSTSPSLLPPVQQAATAATGPATTAQTSTTPATTALTTTTAITAPRTDCRWRQYRDGAIGADPSCATGTLDAAVSGNTAQTICSQAWITAASKLQPPPATLEKLVIEYQLPGNPATYALARVIPVEDGGSATSPMNVYPLPLNGYGRQQTRAVVAAQLHNEICAHKITVAQAAKTLEGDWLSKGLPKHD